MLLIIMAGLNACGLQSKLLITLLSESSHTIIKLQVWCSLKSVTTTLARYTAFNSSYHIGEPRLIPKLLLPCV